MARKAVRDASETAAEYVDVDSLVPWKKNPRKNDRSVDKVVASIEKFGFGAPIVARRANREVIAGHARLKAAIKMGLRSVPVRFLDLTEKQSHAMALADNKLQESSSWDDDLVDQVAQTLRDEPELLKIAGFDPDDFFSDSEDDDGETLVEVSNALRKKWNTDLGQVWTVIGSRGQEHRMMIGDARDPLLVERLVGDRKIDLVFTSPPYNVGIDYDDHDDKTASWPQYRDFLKPIVDAMMIYLDDGRFVAWNIGVSPKTHAARQMVMLEEDCGLEFYRQMIWKKTGAACPTWHLSEAQSAARSFHPNFMHELVLLYSKGAPKKGSRVELDDLLSSDVFELSTTNASSELPRGVDDDPSGPNSGFKSGSRSVHPAVFPLR